MPAYHTHSIFSDKFYNDNLNDNKIFREEIDFESIKTYSLGIDLSNVTLCNINAHNINTRSFLMNMISLVKARRQQGNKYVLAMLYGHILHYFLDITIHPFIYYHEQGMEQAGILSNHTLYEGYISYYFMKKLKHLDITKIGPDYFNKGNLDDIHCQSILNSTYLLTYKWSNATEVYKRTLRVISVLEKFRKFFDIETLKKIIGFTDIVKKYSLKDNDFTNLSKDVWYNPINNEVHSESIDELFDKALIDSCEAISVVNEYLYGNRSLESIEPLFANLSYDTSLPCSLGKKFVYIKKYISSK